MDSLVIFCNNLNIVFAEASHVAESKILFTMIKMIEYLFSFASTHFKKDYSSYQISSIVFQELSRSV